jgi:hypothetical protein
MSASPHRAVRRLCACLLAVLVCLGPSPAFAYLKFGYDVGGQSHTLRWPSAPVRYYVTASAVPGVSASQLQTAVNAAFTSWQDVTTASISYQFMGYTSDLPGEDDGRNTLGFLDAPDLDRVLASTSFLVDDATGDLIESDIFFNSAFPWSVAARGEAGRWDLQSIATHEIGHLSGLGHSALGETELSLSAGRRVLSTATVMFPIASGAGDVSMRTVRADDIAGMSDLYPDGRFNAVTGSLSGRVTKDGLAVYGAHVVAIDVRNGEQVGNFTLSSNGQFSIAGLRPGPHLVRVEPLDDVDVESFFDVNAPVDLDFLAKYYERLVIVPRGGDSGLITVKVTGK